MNACPEGHVSNPAPLASADWACWSVVYLKPDCLRRRLAVPILAWISQIAQVSGVTEVTVTREQIHAHYADLFGRDEEIGADVTAELDRLHVGRRAVVALAHASGAPALLRALIGPTDPAHGGPSTIRGRYGADTRAAAQAERRLIENLIHTSDDPQAARRDFLIWYGLGRASLLTSPPQP
jgi:nucleoside-diphosphate kinase